MARKSAAALSIAPVSEPGRRLPPPADLTADERALWEAVTESKPADWFDADSAPVLKEYVRASVTCDRLSVAVNRALSSGDLVEAAQAEKLLLSRDREARRTTNIATKLRLTQQSRYTPQAAATANRKAGGPRPWQS